MYVYVYKHIRIYMKCLLLIPANTFVIYNSMYKSLLWHNICCWKDAFVGRNDKWIFMQAKAEISHERESLHVPYVACSAGWNHPCDADRHFSLKRLPGYAETALGWEIGLQTPSWSCRPLGSWDLSQLWWEYICWLAYVKHTCPYPSSLLKLSTYGMKLKFRQFFLQIKRY